MFLLMTDCLLLFNSSPQNCNHGQPSFTVYILSQDQDFGTVSVKLAVHILVFRGVVFDLFVGRS